MSFAFIEQNLTKYGYVFLIKFVLFLMEKPHREITSAQLSDHLGELFLVPLAFVLPIWTVQITLAIYSLITKHKISFLSWEEAQDIPEKQKYRFFFPVGRVKKVKLGAAYMPKGKFKRLNAMTAFIYFVYLLIAISMMIITYAESEYLRNLLVLEGIASFDRVLLFSSALVLLGHKTREKW